MKKEKLVLIIISLILIVVPYFFNIYSIYKLISVCLGITLLDIGFTIGKKRNIFLIIYLPILMLILTYGVDYLLTYTFNKSPIYVFENKINNNVSVYNSLFYRIYKCDNKIHFDNNYEDSFMCNTSLIEEIDINKLLNEPEISYKEHKNNFIKVTGKISKITGTNSVEMQEYTLVDGMLNGYVKFNETSKLIINLNGIDVSNYKIYDYMTVVGLLSSYDKTNNVLTLTYTKLEERELYNEYDIHVIESSKCENTLKEYIDNYYLDCLENIYLDYKIDKYELSYALKDKKITIEDFLRNIKVEENENYKVYKHEKFNILSCSDTKNIIINKNKKIDYFLCEEE